MPVALIQKNAEGVLQVNYLLVDHLNTPRVVLSTTNIPIWRWDNADPFGNSAPNQDPDGDGKKVDMNLRFPGQYYDVETGLFYNYFRDYNPATGRYIASDPIGLDGGLNTYGYVNGNQINAVDPLGLKSKFPYSHPHCVAIKKKIDNINRDLDERWDELCRNPQNQPERIGPGELLCETRRGHRTIINDVSRNRDYWQDRYDNECGDDDPDPQPVCNDNCRQVFTK